MTPEVSLQKLDELEAMYREVLITGSDVQAARVLAWVPELIKMARRAWN